MSTTDSKASKRLRFGFRAAGVAVPIILVLAWLASPQFSTPFDRGGPIGETGLVVSHWRKGLEALVADQRFPPESNVGLVNLFENAYESPDWRGPYFGRRVEAVDSWGQPLVYRYPAECAPTPDFDLYSVGENGVDECGRGDDIGGLKALAASGETR